METFNVMLAAPTIEEVGQFLKKVPKSKYTGVVFLALRYLYETIPEIFVYCPQAIRIGAEGPLHPWLISMHGCDRLIILRVKGWETSQDIVKLAHEALAMGKPEYFLTPFVYDNRFIDFSLTPTDALERDVFELERIPEWMAKMPHHNLPSS